MCMQWLNRLVLVCAVSGVFAAWGSQTSSVASAAPDPAGSSAVDPDSEAAARAAAAAAAEKLAAAAAAEKLAADKDAAANAAEATEVELKDAERAIVQREGALNRFAKLRAESEDAKETELGATQVNGSATGIPDTNAPEWSLLADASVSSLDFSQPTLSIGLERAMPTTLALVAFRKNAADNSVTATKGDPAFGRAVLAPALASFSIAGRYEWRPSAHIQCPDDCRAPGRKVTTKKSKGFYVTAEASYAKLVDSSAMRPDGSAVSGYFSPLALAAGVIYRLEGQMPYGAKLGTTKLGLAGFVGGTGRVISGDLDSADRAAIFGTSRRYYGGLEAGAMLQIGNVLIDPRVIALTNCHDRIPGLTGLQLQITLSFQLPWTVLGGTPPGG